MRKESDGSDADADGGTEPEIMGAIDRSEGMSRFVIADVSRDGAWIGVLASEAVVPADWR